MNGGRTLKKGKKTQKAQRTPSGQIQGQFKHQISNDSNEL